jgi:hypothetical protein
VDGDELPFRSLGCTIAVLEGGPLVRSLVRPVLGVRIEKRGNRETLTLEYCIIANAFAAMAALSNFPSR